MYKAKTTYNANSSQHNTIFIHYTFVTPKYAIKQWCFGLASFSYLKY